MEKNSSWDPRKVAHLLVSLEVKFHTVGTMLILKIQGTAHSFSQNEKK